MKFSISLPTGFEGVMYPVPFVDPSDFVRMARLAEKLGYHSVWGNDHIQSQHYVRELYPDSPPNFYELLTVLSFCAAATTTLEVGTALAVQPMRDPFWLAKTAATIDQLSNGRLILALGIGAYREEFAAWAPRLAPKAQRGEMMDEGLALMQRLFTERRVTHEGKYYAVKDIEMYPKPRRDPFALWLGGHNKATIERTARLATGWLPGWRPWPELAEWIKLLKDRASELQAGRRQPRRLARSDQGEGRGPAQDRRRPCLRPDDPRRLDGGVRGSGGVVRQDGDVVSPARDRRCRCRSR
jgi:probable F420-dependent oxidoreductase